MIVKQEKVDKPWGHEVIWSRCDKFVGKILCINKGHKLSRQYHVKKRGNHICIDWNFTFRNRNGRDPAEDRSQTRTSVSRGTKHCS